MVLQYHKGTTVQERIREQDLEDEQELQYEQENSGVFVQELKKGQEHQEKTILIVEDDEDLGTLILEALQQESFYTGVSYRTLLAIDSMEALEIIKETLPDLFLLDYYLPRMNGLDLYDRMHAIETLALVPTIFMSANPPFKELRKRNLLSIRKPFNLRELLHTIESLLEEQNAQ